MQIHYNVDTTKIDDMIDAENEKMKKQCNLCGESTIVPDCFKCICKDEHAKAINDFVKIKAHTLAHATKFTMEVTRDELPRINHIIKRGEEA